MTPAKSVKSITLLELLIAVIIMVLIVIGFSSIDIFSQRQVLASSKRMKCQNEVAYVLEFIAREMQKGSGDISNPAASLITVNSDPALGVWTDFNHNGQRDPSPPDYQMAFAYRGNPDYEMRYYPDVNNINDYEVLSSKIYMLGFSPIIFQNYVELVISACWNPTGSEACGSEANPIVTMRSRIAMPGVSTN